MFKDLDAEMDAYHAAGSGKTPKKSEEKAAAPAAEAPAAES